jgi:PAS domain S-box-containing protein
MLDARRRGNRFMPREARMHSEQLFHSLVEHSADAITLFTPDGTITYANPSTARITGYAAQELEGMDSFAFIHPDDKGNVIHLLTNLIEQAEDFVPLEYRLCHQDGTWRWIEGTATNLLSDPSVGAIACTFRDITEHKQQLANEQGANAEAETRAGYLMTIFEKVATGLAIYDCNGNLKQINTAFRDLFALEAGIDFALLQPDEWCKWAFPRDLEGRPLSQGLWSHFQALDKDSSSKQQTMRLVACNRAGQDFFLDVNVFPIRDTAGQIMGCIAAYLDITQQHQLEQQLQYAERKLRSLVESNIVGVMVTDEAGHVYEVNDWMALGLGYSREELLSGNIRVQDLLVPEYRGARARAWKTLISQGSSLPEEKIYICKDGSRFPVLVGAATINQERSRALVVSLDISDRKEAEQRRQEFLGMVNHELRTPLTVIQGFLELAMFYVERLSRTSAGEQDDFHKLDAMLQQAQQQVEIESRLVTELLDVSRMEMQKFSLSLQSCDLVSLVQQVVANQQQMAPMRYIELKLPPQAEVPVIADTDRIEQVVNNYLSNALKYSPPDRKVSVSIRIEEAMARVSVHDQGPGLTLEQQQHIWERFYQVGIARYSDTFEGLGLGLYIVRTIMAQHQGQVGVESIPGQGATFWFMLPLADEPDDACETQYVIGGGVDDAFHIS